MLINIGSIFSESTDELFFIKVTYMYSMLNELLYINELFKLVSTFEHVDEIPKKKIQKVAIILDRIEDSSSFKCPF